jgi:hypothetical protein
LHILGLSIRCGRLKKEDEQILIDKVAVKLPAWKGRLLNKAAKLTLVNSIISSVLTYHITVFELSKRALKKIDMIRRNFLWHCFEDRRQGQCLVNWKRVQRPKSLGGLGILDLERFGRALRLRQWYVRKSRSKPWNGITIHSSAIEMTLFRTCTSTTLGNGETTSFWHDHWLIGSAPKHVAPLLFWLAW